MISDSYKKPASVLAIALHIAAWIGGLEQNSSACAESPADITVSRRAARVRELVSGAIKEVDTHGKRVQLMQWVNWNNWGNWPNWNNWPNWLSWLKY
jgi:hypothetical protein